MESRPRENNGVGRGETRWSYRGTQHNAGVNIVTPRRRLEPHHRLDQPARAYRPGVVPHAAVAARVARRPDLVEQTLRRQLGELLETGIDDPGIRVQLVGHRRARRVRRVARRQVPVELARLDPLVDRAATHPEASRQRRLRDASLQVVFQQHPRLPSVHRRPAPSLLDSPTSWNAGTPRQPANVCGFRLPQMGNLPLPPTLGKKRETDMRKTHIGATIIAAIIIAASCGDTPNPVAPTPVPEPEPPRPIPTRTLEIIGIPEGGLPAGEVLQLTGEIRQPDGGIEAVFRPTWTSSNPDVAIVELQGTLVALMVGRTEITATHEDLSAMVQLEITPAQPNETLWREIAFNYHDCPPTEPPCTPLETRQLRVLPVTSPSFAIVSHTLSERAIANLHEVLALGVEQITGEPYRGTIEEGDGVKAENWITIEGVTPGNQGKAGSCTNASMPEGASGAATIGNTKGCIMLATNPEAPTTKSTMLHELARTRNGLLPHKQRKNTDVQQGLQ